MLIKQSNIRLRHPPAVPSQCALPVVSANRHPTGRVTSSEKTAEVDQAQLNRESWQVPLGIGLAGVGAGASIRALLGLKDMFTRSPRVDRSSSVPASVPIIVPPREDEEDVRFGSFAKAGAALEKEANGWGLNPFGDARQGVNWWQIPMGIGLGGLGAYGGWKGVDTLLGSRRGAEQESEMEDAKKEYEQALKHQYATSKMGSYTELDGVYDQYNQPSEKQAGGVAGDMMHGVGGAYATLLAVAALGTGTATYGWAKNRNQQKILQEAIKKRRRQRMAPQPVYAYPTPSPSVFKPSEDENEAA